MLVIMMIMDDHIEVIDKLLSHLYSRYKNAGQTHASTIAIMMVGSDRQKSNTRLINNFEKLWNILNSYPGVFINLLRNPIIEVHLQRIPPSQGAFFSTYDQSFSICMDTTSEFGPCLMEFVLRHQ